MYGLVLKSRLRLTNSPLTGFVARSAARVGGAKSGDLSSHRRFGRCVLGHHFWRRRYACFRRKATASKEVEAYALPGPMIHDADTLTFLD